MSGNKVKWILELQDRASGPARKVEGALASLNRAQRFSGRSRTTMAGIERLARSNRAVTRSTRGATAAFTDLGAVGAGAVLGVGAALLGVAYSAGRVGLALGGSVLSAARFREQTLISLRTMLGTSEAAMEVYNNSRRIAQLTPFDTREIVDYARQLSVAGFRVNELTTGLGMLTDARAVMGSEGADSLLRVMTKLRGGAKLQGEMWEQMQTAGVGLARIAPALARAFNINTTGMNEEQVQAAVRAAGTAGRLHGPRALNAVRDTVRSTMSGGGQLGQGARNQADSLEGALSNLRSAFDDMLSGISFEKIPGMTTIKEFIRNLTSQFGTGTPLAQRFTAMITAAINGIGGLLSKIDIKGVVVGLGQALDWVGNAIKWIIPRAMAFYKGFLAPLTTVVPIVVSALSWLFSTMFDGGSSVETFRTIGNVIGTVASVGAIGIGLLIGAVTLLVKSFSFAWTFITAAWTAISESFDTGLDSILDFPEMLATGLMNGLIAGFGAVANRIATFFGITFPQVVKDALGIHSPSRVFEAIGLQTSAGFAQGVTGGESRATDAARSMVQIPAPSVPRGAVGGSVNLTVNVQAPSGDSAQSWGEEIGATIIGLLNGRVEVAALQT